MKEAVMDFDLDDVEVGTKPWEETENEIRNPVRDPDDFQEGSFRRVPLKKDRPRVFAVMGRLKGETTMTIQALRFPKEDGWTIAKARSWQEEHSTKELTMRAEAAKAVTKTDGGVEFTASDYADVPDEENVSTWKVRLAEGRSGNFTIAQVARAITALQPGGYRGQEIELGSPKAEVIGRINAAIGKIEDADDEQKESLRERLSAVKSLHEEEDALDEGEPAGGEKAGRRLNKGMLEQIRSAIEALKAFLGWAGYEEAEQGKESPAAEDIRQLMGRSPQGSAFKVFKDRQGRTRWLAFSANAFRDREGEIFSTKALEEAVAYADRTGQRGPLLLWHEPVAKIGECDFQGVEGRFLIESGTFDDTPLGRKACEFFESTDEPQAVSIGYRYRKGDKRGGIYGWFRAFERSALPLHAAANVWTEFRAIGGAMERDKEGYLAKVLGAEAAQEVIMEANRRTKDLEEEGVAHKGGDGAEPGEGDKAKTVVDSLGELGMLVGKVGDADLKARLKGLIDEIGKALAAGSPGPEKEATAKKEGDGEAEEQAGEAGGEDESPKPADGEAPDAALAQLLGDVVQKANAPMAEAIGQVQAQVASLSEWRETMDADVKALKETDESKLDKAVGDAISRRAAGPGTAASQRDDNVADAEAAKQLESQKAEGDENPAAPYVKDAFGAPEAQQAG